MDKKMTGADVMDQDPLRRALLDLGPDLDKEDWAAYDGMPAVKSAPDGNVLGLIRPYLDSEVNLDDAYNWVPVRAWRIAARRRLVEAIEPMLTIADHDDDHLAYMEFPQVAALVGAPAIPPLAGILANRARSDTQRLLAARGLATIAEDSGIDARKEAIAALVKQIESSTPEDGDVNAVAAKGLFALKALEAKDPVFTAYLAGRISLGVAGAEEMEQVFGPLPT
jgi:hypothetical protein